MKKWMLIFPTCLLMVLVAFAVSGGAEDPLVSLSYLTGSFTEKVEKQVDQRLQDSDAQILESVDSGTIATNSTSLWAETRLKQGDVLLGNTGMNVLLLAGGGQIQYNSGAVVDVTTGEVVDSGAGMTVNHRYLVAEDTSAVFMITTKTAVVKYQGNYDFTYSDAVDYNAMASALKTLNLFKGSFTGYGEGFDLEMAPTRLQALIMFIRVLGEEEQALAWTGTTPFTDIQKGSQAEQYVGYAYERGYTNGFSATTFKPGNAVNARQYTEFILRAMGYSSAANTNLSDTLLRAQEAGVLTAGEAAELEMTERFLRADLVYISYYALEADLPDGTQSLGQLLMDKGVFTRRAWREAAELVTSWRL